MYLQFWFSSNDSSTRTHMATTTIPIPYGLASSWPGMDIVRSSADYGYYDTRMDAGNTSALLPTRIDHVVRFKNPFVTPPVVMVWLTGLSAARGTTVSVQLSANNVTETDFTLQITSGLGFGAVLRSVGVAWAVWTVASGWGQHTTKKVGTVSTVSPGGVRVSNLTGSGKLAGDSTALVAVCAVDLVLGGGVWIDVEMEGGETPPELGPQRPSDPVSYGLGFGSTTTSMFGQSSVRKEGLMWKLNAGPVGARLYSARITYLSG